MKKLAIPIGILVLAALFLSPDSTPAKNISVTAGRKIIKKCDGAKWDASSTAQGTYGCVNRDGSGVVCGGVEPKSGKKTCDTFRKAPSCYPTRDEVTKAEMAEEATPKR
jgi:hypothetical protein